MPDKWERVFRTDQVRHASGKYHLVLECFTNDAYESRDALIADIVQRLNSNLPDTVRVLLEEKCMSCDCGISDETFDKLETEAA